VLLCVVGGSADAIAFLRYDTFVGAMTGNTVLLGIDLAEGKLRPRGYFISALSPCSSRQSSSRRPRLR